MSVKRPDNFFGIIERNIRQQAKASGITLSDLAKYIEMTEAGFYKMLSTESIKVKTLRKISQVLKQPIPYFFENHLAEGGGSYKQSTELHQVAEPVEGYYNEKESLKKQIALLESQLKDKELIIELLGRK